MLGLPDRGYKVFYPWVDHPRAKRQMKKPWGCVNTTTAKDTQPNHANEDGCRV